MESTTEERALSWVKKDEHGHRFLKKTVLMADLDLPESVNLLHVAENIVSVALEEPDVVQALATVNVPDDLIDIRDALSVNGPYTLDGDDFIFAWPKPSRNSRPVLLRLQDLAVIKTPGRALIASTHDVKIRDGVARTHPNGRGVDMEMGASQIQVLLHAVEQSGLYDRFHAALVAKMEAPAPKRFRFPRKRKGGNPHLSVKPSPPVQFPWELS